MTPATWFWACAGLVGYTGVGYPALVWALGWARRADRYPPAAPPPVTVVIAAHNEAAVIAQKLENTLALAYPEERLQVVVAADGSDDSTTAIVERYADRGVELSYHPDRAGKASALNRAVRLARGDIVVFSDANNRYDGEALRYLVEPFTDPTVGMVTGAKLIDSGPDTLMESESGYWRYESALKRWETRFGCCVAVAGEILAVRRELIPVLPPDVINEDLYLAMRVLKHDHRVVYAERARSWEATSSSARQEVERRARVVAGRYQVVSMGPRALPIHRPVVMWQLVSHKLLRPVVPMAMLGALAAAAGSVVLPSRSATRRLRTLGPPFNWIVLGSQCAAYASALAAPRLAPKNGPWRLLHVPAYALDVNRAALAGLWRGVRGRQSQMWKRVERHGAETAGG